MLPDLAHVAQRALVTNAFNVVGERHDISDERREREKAFVTDLFHDPLATYTTETTMGVVHDWRKETPPFLPKTNGVEKDWVENRELTLGYQMPVEGADPPALRMMQDLTFALKRREDLPVDQSEPEVAKTRITMRQMRESQGYGSFYGEFEQLEHDHDALIRERTLNDPKTILSNPAQQQALAELQLEVARWKDLVAVLVVPQKLASFEARQQELEAYLRTVFRLCAAVYDYSGSADLGAESADEVAAERSLAMHVAAESLAPILKGVWKIGDLHAREIEESRIPTSYNLVRMDEFELEFAASAKEQARSRRLTMLGAWGEKFNVGNEKYENTPQGVIRKPPPFEVPIGADF